MFNFTMPTINLDAMRAVRATLAAEPETERSKTYLPLIDEALTMAPSIVSSKGKTKGQIKKSRGALTGPAAYVWRQLVFMVSPVGQHQCLPMMADFLLSDVDYGTADLRRQKKEIEARYAGNSDIIAYFSDPEYQRLSAEQRTKQRAVEDHLQNVAAVLAQFVPQSSRHSGGMARWGDLLGYTQNAYVGDHPGSDDHDLASLGEEAEVGAE